MQLTPISRMLLFFFCCIPLRLCLAYGTKWLSEAQRIAAIIIFTSIGLSFLYLFLTNQRLQAPEAGGQTWWKELRLLHGIIYVLSAVLLCMKQQETASMLLYLDVIVAILAFQCLRN